MVIPHNSSTVSRGEHLAVIKGCLECHGKKLAGQVMMNDAGLGQLAAANLTKGKAGRW